jgi:hypothetical protein
MEYAATVIGYLKLHKIEIYNAVEKTISEDAEVQVYAQPANVDVIQTLNKIEKTIDKLQAATQSTGMLMAIRAMCEDCAGGPASDPQSFCWWKSCPLREFSDMRLADKAKSHK